MPAVLPLMVMTSYAKFDPPSPFAQIPSAVFIHRTSRKLFFMFYLFALTTLVQPIYVYLTAV